MPSRRLKELIEGTVDHHASQRWPALEEVTISWRGSYGYLTGYLSDSDDDTIKLCRIQYLGDPDDWAFAIWQASSDSYGAAVLLDGSLTGHPNQALDTACTLIISIRNYVSSGIPRWPSLLLVRAVSGGYGRSVDVTVLAGEPGVLEACLGGAGPAAAVTLGRLPPPDGIRTPALQGRAHMLARPSAKVRPGAPASPSGRRPAPIPSRLRRPPWLPRPKPPARTAAIFAAPDAPVPTCAGPAALSLASQRVGASCPASARPARRTPSAS